MVSLRISYHSSSLSLVSIISSCYLSIGSLFCRALSCVESEFTFMLALFWFFPGFLDFFDK